MNKSQIAYEGKHWVAYWRNDVRGPLKLLYMGEESMENLTQEAIKEVIEIANKVFSRYDVDYIDYVIEEAEDSVIIYPVLAKMETLNWDIVVFIDVVIAVANVTFDWDVGIPLEVKEELDEALKQCNANNMAVTINIDLIRSGVRLSSGLH